MTPCAIWQMSSGARRSLGPSSRASAVSYSAAASVSLLQISTIWRKAGADGENNIYNYEHFGGDIWPT